MTGEGADEMMFGYDIFETSMLGLYKIKTKLKMEI